jgi:hypothetical protein
LIIRDEPGYYELVIDPGPAGLLLAMLISRQAERPFWFVSMPMLDDVRMALGSFSLWPMYAANHVRVVFGMIQECQPGASDLVVVCDLETLLPDHRSSRYIAKSVQRAIAGWEPEMPVLVLNQHRHPAPPGGVYWRTRCRSRRLRTLYNDYGLTLAHLEGGDRFVMAGPGREPAFCPAGEEGTQLIRELGLAERIDNRWLIV